MPIKEMTVFDHFFHMFSIGKMQLTNYFIAYSLSAARYSASHTASRVIQGSALGPLFYFRKRFQLVRRGRYSSSVCRRHPNFNQHETVRHR